MGLFDAMKDIAANALGGDHASLASAATQVLGAQSGGLGALVAQFSQAGLGSQAASWVGPGQNAPVSGPEIHQALGSDVVAQIAAKAGISPQLAQEGLALVLPLLIDKATPHGQIPGGGGSLSDGLGGLLSMLGKNA